MSINKNSAGFETIFEVATTDDVAFASGEFYATYETGNRVNSGFKIKASATGTIKVQYMGDDSGRVVDLVITSNDLHVWLSDRIKRIIESGTTVPAGNILVGW